MSQMSKHYEQEFKKKIVRLHLEEGRTLKGLAAEYGVSKASISIWLLVWFSSYLGCKFGWVVYIENLNIDGKKRKWYNFLIKLEGENYGKIKWRKWIVC